MSIGTLVTIGEWEPILLSIGSLLIRRHALDIRLNIREKEPTRLCLLIPISVAKIQPTRPSLLETHQQPTSLRVGIPFAREKRLF